MGSPCDLFRQLTPSRTMLVLHPFPFQGADSLILGGLFLALGKRILSVSLLGIRYRRQLSPSFLNSNPPHRRGESLTSFDPRRITAFRASVPDRIRPFLSGGELPLGRAIFPPLCCRGVYFSAFRVVAQGPFRGAPLMLCLPCRRWSLTLRLPLERNAAFEDGAHALRMLRAYTLRHGGRRLALTWAAAKKAVCPGRLLFRPWGWGSLLFLL